MLDLGVLVVEPNLPDPEILFSRVCNPGVLYTHSPCLGVRGYVLSNSFVDPWYWINPRIFPWYFPYKRKHCKTIEYGMVLHCIGRETVRALLTPLC